jgi:hypothetical protein
LGDWSTYNTATSQSKIAVAAEEHARLSEQLARITDRLDILSEQIASEFPDGPGDHAIVVEGKTVISCSRSEVWSWDQEYLEQLFAAGTAPEHVKVRYSVDKRRFEHLPDDEKKLLIPALTRKAGKARIAVKEVSA